VLRLCTALSALAAAAPSVRAAEPIDRHALVTRHDPVLHDVDVESPLSVGNGELAFTVDATGLQTFPGAFEKTIPLGTLSQWGWHTAPNPEGWSIESFPFEEFASHGRPVGYADIPGDRRTPEIDWLRANPHRLHLGQIGFELRRADGSAATREDLTDVEQTLDLWMGVIHSRFRLEGELVEVVTLCHPDRDALGISVRSPLLAAGRAGIRIRFPYGTADMTAADWTRPEAHRTTLTPIGDNGAQLVRQLDGDSYVVDARWEPAGALRERGAHDYLLSTGESALDLVVAFSPRPDDPPSRPPGFREVAAAARGHWNDFWNSGAAVDLSGSADPRWRELERRIVLSQYLTAIQCAGSLPPQESGLTFNSWNGKFHLEMHWWHSVQFALWGRLPLLEKSLAYYERILPRARATARRQGYEGARWPKMTGPNGAESPSSIGPFLVWQQPHPIYYAEIAYRQRGDRATLDRFRPVVFETAEFMASFATWEQSGQRFVLGPPLQCAQEVFPEVETVNCTFELEYWRWGLETAQTWRQRLGLARDPDWERVLASLATPSVEDGRYTFAETAPDSYSDPRWARDHPMVAALYGVLPGIGIDLPTMRRTLAWILDNWSWPDTWGWDYPMVAMCAARLGEPERAVDALLMDTPKNHFRLDGHNHQRPGLTIYLPGNGALLTAIAMMAGGWDGAPDRPAPGFPDEGWTVRAEGFRPLP
jgi:hypothetical protein